MADPQQILNEFIDAYERDGSTDPRDYLSRVEGAERQELQALIGAFLARASRRAWNREEFSGSLAERATEAAIAEGAGVGWSTVLPDLRDRAKLKRGVVVERLAVTLGFPDSADRVATYYHRMERDQLPVDGVSTKVLDALAAILATTTASLRTAGEAGGGGLPGGGEVFARGGAPEGMASPAATDALQVDADRTAPDELDRLFTEGD